MNNALRRLIRKQKRVFIEEGGRTEKWKQIKAKTNRILAERKAGYLLKQKDHLLVHDANRSFFRIVKNYKSGEKTQDFVIRSMFKGDADDAIAEKLADFFNRISDEFEPFAQEDILTAAVRVLPKLELHEVSTRIRKFRKPKSMVKGDLFPQLFSDFLTIPLADIYNEISICLLYTSPSPRDRQKSRMPSSA